MQELCLIHNWISKLFSRVCSPGKFTRHTAFTCTFLSGINWDWLQGTWSSASYVCSYGIPLHCRNLINMFATAEGLLTQQDRLNSDGLQEVFATNLFGHFLLVLLRLYNYIHMYESRCWLWIPWCNISFMIVVPSRYSAVFAYRHICQQWNN